MSSNASTAPCGGCGAPVGPVHRCPTCCSHMHPFCGRPVGNEGFGQAILCPGCDHPPPTAASSHSASPIIAALQQQEHQAVSPKPRNEPNAVSTNSKIGSDSSSDESPAHSRPQEAPIAQPTSLTRHTQVVSTIAHRRRVIWWMQKHEATRGDEGMFAKAVDTFPAIFNSATRGGNLAKSVDWWAKRNRFLDAARWSVAVSARRRGGRRRVSTKVVSGRGRPRSPWAEWLYPLLLDEFDRLRKLDVKFGPRCCCNWQSEYFGTAPGRTTPEA